MSLLRQVGSIANIDQRKPVAPKKANNQEGDENSPRHIGLSNEDQTRMHLMEDRINMLEDALAKSRSEADEARLREMAMMGLVRDMIGHIAASESGRLYLLSDSELR